MPRRSVNTTETTTVSLAELKARSQRRGLFSRLRSALSRQRAPVIKTGEEQINALWGNNLTWFVGSDGKGLGIGGPPLHAAHNARTDLRAPRFIGRSLTRHLSLRGKLETELHLLHQSDKRPLLLRMLLGVWSALKWLLLIKPRLQVLERYVWGEALTSFLVGSMAVTFFLVGTTIFTFGEKIFTKNIPPFTITKIMLLGAPQFLILAIPIAVLFSTLMAMGRFNRDNELIAMSTSGVSLYRIFLPFIGIAVMSGWLTWAVYESVVPQNSREMRTTFSAFYGAQVVDFIKEKIVIAAPGRKYIYIDRINKTESTMHDIRLWDYLDDNSGMRSFPRMFKAEKGYMSEGFLVLENVSFYEIDRNYGRTLVEARMPEVRIDIATQLAGQELRPEPTELRALELRARISRDRDRVRSMTYLDPSMLSNLNKDLVGYYFKYSIPLACLAFVLVAVPVSLRGPRDERNLGIILTFGLVMVYYIIFFTCREVGSRGLILQDHLQFMGMTLARKGTNLFPPHIAGWLPPLVFFVASIPLIMRARR